MSLRLLYYVLWIAPVPVFVCLTAVMVRRKLQKEFPLFFAFVAFQIADFAIGFLTYHRSQQQYFYAYWTLAALEIGLGIGVLHEVFTAVFRPFTDLRELGGVLFRWAALVLTAAALLMAASSGSLPGWRIVGVILNGVRSIEVMQCGLVLLMLICSAYLGITLRHRIFGIALGFGVTAAVDLMVVAVFANFGPQSQTFFQLSRMVAYNLSALLWLGYVYAGEVECRPTKQFTRAERWDYALATALHPGSNSPTLPLIEDTVDRVWKQANGRSGSPKHATHSADQ
jgi:hypothetical protein